MLGGGGGVVCVDGGCVVVWVVGCGGFVFGVVWWVVGYDV